MWQNIDWGKIFVNTVFLLKIRHEKNIAFAEFLEVNIQHSVYVHIPFLFIAYTHDDLCQKVRDYIIFNHSVKGAE